MSLANLFPFYNGLSENGKRLINDNIVERVYKEDINVNEMMSDTCLGVVYIIEGQIRSYINTEDDKEITLFNLFNGDFCLFSASCIFTSLEYEVFIDIKKNTRALIIPPAIVKKLNDTEITFLKHINELMSKRLSDAMWTIDQILSKRLDERIIDLLINEYQIRGTTEIEITHDEIANHLGSSREVITRMLKHIAMDGLITLKRGRIIINDIKKLI